jgi:hypothetical protein
MRLGRLRERRAAPRNKLTLQVEIRLKTSEAISGSTRDISTRGFYLAINHAPTVGTAFQFSINVPWEATEASRAFVSGRARVVRVERTRIGVAAVGIGAKIETYKFGPAE